ncbi:hypothetical protein V8E54_002788 [Elaphomyces granulatus]
MAHFSTDLNCSMDLNYNFSVDLNCSHSSMDRNWHGSMVPDYNALYTNYYVPLQCNPELVPVGVVGFYVWSVLFIVTISSFGKQFDEVDFSFRRLLNGITGIATYSLHIYSLLKRNYECYGEALNVLGYLKDPISEYYITKLVNYGLGALVGICAVIDSVWKPFRYVTLWTVALQHSRTYHGGFNTPDHICRHSRRLTVSGNGNANLDWCHNRDGVSTLGSWNGRCTLCRILGDVWGSRSVLSKLDILVTAIAPCAAILTSSAASKYLPDLLTKAGARFGEKTGTWMGGKTTARTGTRTAETGAKPGAAGTIQMGALPLKRRTFTTEVSFYTLLSVESLGRLRDDKRLIGHHAVLDIPHGPFVSTTLHFATLCATKTDVRTLTSGCRGCMSLCDPTMEQ